MKKSLLQVIVFFILVTVGLGFLQKHLIDSRGEEELIPVDAITETKEVSLSKWLELYHNGVYKKIEIKDSTDMKGFILVGTGEDTGFSFLGAKKALTNEFVLAVAKKPLDTSISELGISLTGATIVTTTYTESSRRMKLIEQFGIFILIFLLFIFGAKFMLGKGNGAGGLLNVQVGKKSEKDKSKTRFHDIAGMAEVKNELIEVVDYLKNPDKYKKV
ncbi:MAG: hypothetical protein LBO09_09560 [Candidatus Peribacteria bacterium]|jgi:cell division protease FtsH|nr:hypothetical protein [Candidatus Peribacteria bacterium]